MSRACLAGLLVAIILASAPARVLANAHNGRCVYGHWQQVKPGCYMKKMTLPGGGNRWLWFFERNREWMYVFNPYEPRRWTARYPTKYNDECDGPQVATEMCPEGQDPCKAHYQTAPAPLEAQNRQGQMVRVDAPNPRDLPPGI